MTFSEKLLKLRKENNLSQEALAEKLGTTRQAISKWENGQGFPETEKLLMMGNLFEVTIDYLLKDSDETNNPHEKGYYVSREVAEGYLISEKRSSAQYALGLSILALATIPYLLFGQSPTIWVFATIIIAAVGIGIILFAGLKEDDQYAHLTKEPLILDANFLKEIKQRYQNVKKKSAPLVVAGICCIVMGGLPFLFVKKAVLPQGAIEPYYPAFVLLIALGIYALVRQTALTDAYALIAENEKHINSAGHKILKKAKRKLEDLK